MRKRAYSTLHDINVVNLVDVVLVLLIIFMIAAPMFQSGIDINLPRTKATQEDLGEGVVVTITKEKKIYVIKPNGPVRMLVGVMLNIR